MFKKVIYRFALVLLALIFSIGLIELGYRSYVFIWNPPYIFKPYLAVPNPGGSGYRNGKHITFDKNGFRNPYLEKIEPTDRNILLIGDSVAFGLSVNDDETIQYYLQKLYEESNINIINISKPGWCTLNLRLLLFSYLNKSVHKIDGIIWFYNINDALRNIKYLPLHLSTGEELKSISEAVVRRNSDTVFDKLSHITWPYLKSLSYISFKYNKYLALLNNSSNETISWTEYYNHSLNTFKPGPKRSLEKIFLGEILFIASKYNIPIQFVITPYLDQFKDNQLLPQKFLQNELRNRAPLLDLFPHMQKEKDVTQFFPPGDNGHFTREGNRYIAQKIKENLQPEKYFQ